MRIAVDFDGTIVEHKYPEIGREIPFAIDALRELAEEGHKIILWTVREGDRLQAAVDYCRSRGLEFYAVNSDLPENSWTDRKVSRKIQADLFIDDCNFGGLPDWGVIYQTIAFGNPFKVDPELGWSPEESAMAAASGRTDGGLDGFGKDAVYSKKHHKAHKPSIFKRIAQKCEDSREKYR